MKVIDAEIPIVYFGTIGTASCWELTWQPNENSNEIVYKLFKQMETIIEKDTLNMNNNNDHNGDGDCDEEEDDDDDFDDDDDDDDDDNDYHMNGIIRGIPTSSVI